MRHFLHDIAYVVRRRTRIQKHVYTYTLQQKRLRYASVCRSEQIAALASAEKEKLRGKAANQLNGVPRHLFFDESGTNSANQHMHMYPYTSAICIFRSLFACLCSLRFIMIATVLSRSYYSFSYSMMLCGPASASQLRQNLCCCSGCSYHSHVCLFTALL